MSGHPVLKFSSVHVQVVMSLAAGALLLSSCASTSRRPDPPPEAGSQAGAQAGSDEPAPGSNAMVLVHLKTGPRSGQLPDDENREAFAGHFANMQRLAEERRLLLAGPFGRERHDPTLRGLFVLDVADPEVAKEWASTDPAVQAGIFIIEAHRLVTGAPLRAFLEGELRRADEARRAGREQPPAEGIRSYVLFTADDGDAAERALAPLVERREVLLVGRLDGRRGFVVLDARTLDEARHLLTGADGDLGPHVLDAWFASDGVADLPRLRDHGSTVGGRHEP